jgi:HEAT repeat protein
MNNMRRTFVTTSMVAGFVAAAAVLAAPAPARGQDVPFETVVAGLKSPDASARIGSLVALRQAGYLEAAPAIAPLLADPDPTVQGAAVEAILSLFLVDPKYTYEIGRSVVKEKGATLALYAFVQGPGATVPNAVPAAIIRGLADAVGSATPAVRFDAAYALAVLGKPLVLQGQFPDGRAAVSRLLALLSDPHPVMRQAATNALGRLFGAAIQNPAASAEFTERRAEVGDQIVNGLNDADADLRLASMGALGQMRYERAVQSLTDLFNYYKKGPEAMAAFDAVARIGHPGSLPVFLAQLGHREALVRRLAVEGIARTGDAEAMAQMETRLAHDQSAFVVHARAFAKARTGDFSQMVKLVEGFKYSLLESDTFEYLVELGQPAAGELAGFSTHKDARVRAGVAEVLGVIGNQTSLGVIEALRRDGNSLVAAAAARSQMRLTPRSGAAARLP